MSENAGVGRREVLKVSAAVLGAAVIPTGVGLAHGEGPLDERQRPAAALPPQGAAPSFPALFEKTEWDRRGLWSASWVGCADAPEPPLVAAYRLRFDWPASASRAPARQRRRALRALPRRPAHRPRQRAREPRALVLRHATTSP